MHDGHNEEFEKFNSNFKEVHDMISEIRHSHTNIVQETKQMKAEQMQIKLAQALVIQT